MEPITAEEVAPFFYEYLHAEKYRELKDAQTVELKGRFISPKIERLLERQPFPKIGKPFVFENNRLTVSTVHSSSNRLYEIVREIVQYRINIYFAKKGN